MKKGNVVVSLAGLCVGALGAVAAYTSNNHREQLMNENVDLVMENARLKRQAEMNNRITSLEKDKDMKNYIKGLFPKDKYREYEEVGNEHFNEVILSVSGNNGDYEQYKMDCRKVEKQRKETATKEINVSFFRRYDDEDLLNDYKESVNKLSKVLDEFITKYRTLNEEAKKQMSV